MKISNFKLKFFILSVIAVGIPLLIVFNYIITQETILQDRIYPNVFINNKDFGRQPKQYVFDYFTRSNSSFGKANISVLYEEIPVATFSALELKIGYDAKGIIDRAYLIGRAAPLSARIYQKLATIFNWQTFKIQASLEFDESFVEEFITDMKEQRDTPAKDALFSFENGKVISFRQEENGVEIDENTFFNDIRTQIHSLDKKVESKRVKLIANVIEPKITLAKANDFGIEELIAVGKSDFTHSIPGRVHNLTLAASKFNGVLIPKGETLSFNATVGDISSLTGYQPAYIIKSGKTVLVDGGGVCQVSTTLFRAALNAGLPIVERTAHAYRVSYYENDSKPGFDATVYAPSPDLKIKNDTPAAILIQTEIDKDNNLLYFRFYGKKDDRTVEISPVTVYDIVPPLPEIRQDDPTLKKGVVKQVDFPAYGSKAVFNYKVTRNNETSFEKKFLSVYRPWQAVYLVGTAD